MGILPTEIVTEILAALPVKDVLRFRSVCKSWRIIIDDRRFAIMHMTRAIQADTNTTSTFIFVPFDLHALYLVQLDENENDSTSYYSTKMDFSCGKDLVSCRKERTYCIHGLLGVSSCPLNIHTIIYNPATQEVIRLLNIYEFGFGFDSINEEYKVVLFLAFWSSNHGIVHELQAFSPASNSRRKLEGKNARFYDNQPSPALVHGSLHWLVLCVYIQTFDLSSEKFGSIPYPRGIGHHITQVLNFGGFLSLVDVVDKYSLDLWTMKEYNVKESWTKLSIKTRSYPTQDENGFFIEFRLISMRKNGDILFLYNKRQLVSYNVESEIFSLLQIDGIPCLNYEVHPYVGNLMPLAQQPAEEKSRYQKRKRGNNGRKQVARCGQ